MRTIGRYQVTESLGQGGMGTVYKAFDPLLARTVAVKVIAAELGDSAEHHDRFFREARAAAHLSHRNIITIHDLGEENGMPFLAMEFLEGRDLEHRMRSGEPMTLARKLEIALGVCDGLGHAHACGVLHRDIKPANIFITDAGEVKILDFGLARLVSSELTHSNVMLGTVNYMAPEQIRAERPDHRADIFSLGVVLYELLGGRKAFAADSFASTIYKILQDTPAPLDEVDAGIPPELAGIVGRAMAKAREDRYQHVPELARDLERVYTNAHGADLRFVRGFDGDSRPRPPSGVPAEVYEAPTMVGVASFEPTPVPARPASGVPPTRPGSGGAYAPSEPPATAPPAVAARRPRTWGAFAAVGFVIVTLGIVLAWRGRGPVSDQPRPTAARAMPAARDADDPSAAGPPAVPVPPAHTTSPSQGIPEHPVPSIGEVPTPADDPRTAIRARAARNLRSARSAFDAGQHAEASQLVSEVLRDDPANRDALQLQARLTAEARGRAERGLSDMDAARRAAVAANAPSAAPDLFAVAERSANAARQSATATHYADAATRADDARALYGDAESAARRRAAADAEQARAAEAGRRAAERQDSTAAPVPAVVPPSVPVVVPPIATAQEPRPEQLVAAVVDRYVAALEARDIDALHSIWPGLGGAQESAIRADFDNARSIEAGLGALRIDVTGATATATGIRRYVVRTRDGHRLESESQTTIQLRRSGAQWVIDGIRYQPVR